METQPGSESGKLKTVQKVGLERGNTWYEHKTQRVAELDTNKILWRFSSQTGQVLAHDKPDLVVVDKGNHICYIVDVACFFDPRIVKKGGQTLV